MILVFHHDAMSSLDVGVLVWLACWECPYHRLLHSQSCFIVIFGVSLIEVNKGHSPQCLFKGALLEAVWSWIYTSNIFYFHIYFLQKHCFVYVFTQGENWFQFLDFFYAICTVLPFTESDTAPQWARKCCMRTNESTRAKNTKVTPQANLRQDRDSTCN